MTPSKIHVATLLLNIHNQGDGSDYSVLMSAHWPELLVSAIGREVGVASKAVYRNLVLLYDGRDPKRVDAETRQKIFDEARRVVDELMEYKRITSDRILYDGIHVVQKLIRIALWAVKNMGKADLKSHVVLRLPKTDHQFAVLSAAHSFADNRETKTETEFLKKQLRVDRLSAPKTQHEHHHVRLLESPDYFHLIHAQGNVWISKEGMPRRDMLQHIRNKAFEYELLRVGPHAMVVSSSKSN